MKKIFSFNKNVAEDKATQVETTPGRLDVIADLCVTRLSRLLRTMGDKSADHAIALFAKNTSTQFLALDENGNGAKADWRSGVAVDIDKPARWAKYLIFGFVAFFLLWSVMLPLSGAVVASGSVTVDGRNFAIQHQQGGLIESVFVTEGSSVSKGEPLVQLQNVQAKATVEQLVQRYVALKAREASLIAERDGLAEPVFNAEDIELAQTHGALGQVQEQVREFNARKARMESEEVILRERLVALDQEIVGLAASEKSTRTQLDLINNEVEAKAILVRKGLTARSEFNGLKRAQADLEGRLGAGAASRGRVFSAVTEAKEQLTRLDNQRSETASTGLNELRVNLVAVTEQLRSARDVLDRTLVRAPADGVVIGLVANAVGSVIPAGQSIATLLPADAVMIVEARIAPKDVSRVQKGDPATVRFSALNSRNTPEVEATIAYLSPDRLTDRNTGQAFYLAKLKMPQELPDGIVWSDIAAGIPVDTFLGNEERTFIGYLLQPITESLSRAFRES